MITKEHIKQIEKILAIYYYTQQVDSILHIMINSFKQKEQSEGEK